MIVERLEQVHRWSQGIYISPELVRYYRLIDAMHVAQLDTYLTLNVEC